MTDAERHGWVDGRAAGIRHAIHDLRYRVVGTVDAYGAYAALVPSWLAGYLLVVHLDAALRQRKHIDTAPATMTA